MNQYLPQVVPTRRPLVFWLVSVAVVTWIVSLIVVAPVAAAGGHNEIAEGIYRGFGIFCHQRPDRSYFIEGHKLAVCSRCTGLYAGFAFTLLIIRWCVRLEASRRHRERSYFSLLFHCWSISV